MNVLIVEDEALVAMNLASVVEALALRPVGPVPSAWQALALAETVRPDAALVDNTLADGETGTRLARTLNDRYGTLVIAVSATPERMEAEVPRLFRIVPKPYVNRAIECALDEARAALATGGAAVSGG